MYVVFEVLFEGGKSFAIKRHAACMGIGRALCGVQSSWSEYGCLVRCSIPPPSTHFVW